MTPTRSLTPAGRLRLSYAGEFDRAFNAMARVGVIARDRGQKQVAAQAFLEAAHIARWSGDLERARELLIVSYQVGNKM